MKIKSFWKGHKGNNLKEKINEDPMLSRSYLQIDLAKSLPNNISAMEPYPGFKGFIKMDLWGLP